MITAIVTYTKLPNGVMRRTSQVCTARGPAIPGVGDADVRAQVVKLVPKVGIAAAPKGWALVQLESLFWVQSPATQDLGTVPLLGHQVAITIRVATVTWDFGDGATATSTGPGRPYVSGDKCGKQCTDWFGHTYTKTGTVTVKATVNWTATYTVDGGAPRAITDTVPGPPDTVTMPVKEARAVLVPVPTK